MDRMIDRLMEHDSRLDYFKENMATKTDMREIMNTLDKLLGLYQKHDQEITMMIYGNRRLDDKVAVLEKDMTRVKPLVGLNA